MFYSVFHQKPANLSFRPTTKMKIVGYFVRIGKRFHIVNPSANPVIRQGKKQFWFYHDHRPLLAIQERNGVWHT